MQSYRIIGRCLQMKENVPDSIFSSRLEHANFYENLTPLNVKSYVK